MRSHSNIANGSVGRRQNKGRPHSPSLEMEATSSLF